MTGGIPDPTADLQTVLRQQETLRAVIESISSELELRPLLTRIVRHACELIGADNGTIGLVDHERGVVRTEAAYQMPDDELGAEMPPGVGVAGHVLQTRQPLLLNRYGDIDSPTQRGLLENTVIGMPIFWRGEMIGFFGIGAAPPLRFEERDVETLAVFARHAAIAIENARRYEWEQRRTERLALIARIGRIITADLRLEDLLQNTADAIHDLLGYPNIALCLIAPDDPEALVICAVGGHYRKIVTGQYRLPLSQGLMGAAARERRVILINDVERDPRYVPTPGAAGITAEVAVPILLGERVLGVLNVESGARFTEEDAGSLRIIADQLAVALEHARLFADARRALDETQLLYQTSRRISTAMDVDAVVRAYLEEVAARGPYACTIALYERDDKGRRTAVLVQGRWTPQEGVALETQRHPYTRDALDPLLDAGQTVTIRDVHTDERASDALRRIQKASGRPALAMIPLLVHGYRIGLVLLSYGTAHTWEESDLQRYQATAAQLATVVDSRHQRLLLYERGQQVAVLEERQRLARELHDSVTQLLFSVTLIAQSVTPAWQRDPAEGERRVARLLELSRSALAEMRALLAELRPSEVALSAETTLPGIVRVRRDGLVAALRAHGAGIAVDGLRIEIEAAGYEPQPPEHEEALYRITQEALNNIQKHARARVVTIYLRVDASHAHLTIHDDGVGIGQDNAAAPPEARDGMGLSTMRERAEVLGGRFFLTSAPGKGTTVEVILPRRRIEAHERR